MTDASMAEGRRLGLFKRPTMTHWERVMLIHQPMPDVVYIAPKSWGGVNLGVFGHSSTQPGRRVGLRKRRTTEGDAFSGDPWSGREEDGDIG